MKVNFSQYGKEMKRPTYRNGEMLKYKKTDAMSMFGKPQCAAVYLTRWNWLGNFLENDNKRSHYRMPTLQEGNEQP